MKKLIVLISVFLLVGCACSTNTKPSTTPTPSPETSKIKEAKDIAGEETQFGTPLVSLKMKDGQIIEISIDEITNDSTKKQLGDQYQLPDTAVDTWANQIRKLEETILKDGIESIQTDTSGKAVNEDLLSGCTIQIDNYLKTVRKAMNEAK